MANSEGVITLATARRCEARRDFALAAHCYALLAGRILSAHRRQALRALQKETALRAVEAWNQIRPIGTPIVYLPTLAPGGEEPSEAGVTLSLAHVSDAGHPVLFVSCRTGYVALAHVQWQWQPRCALCLGPSPAAGYLWPRCACTEETTCATCVARAGAIGVAEGPIRTSLGHAPHCPACVEPEIEGISCRALREPGEAQGPAQARQGEAWLRSILDRQPDDTPARLLLAVHLLAALFAPWIVPHDPTALVGAPLEPPGAEYRFGTDELGRDITSRIFYGARYSLAIGAGTAVMAAFFGTLMGLLAGFFKSLDAVLMRLVDAMMAFPDILLGIALVSILGASPVNVVLALTLVYTPRVARVVRASTLVIRELPYIEAARAVGLSTPRLLFNHILPNLMSPILVQLSFIFAYALLAEAGLSFLGVGVGAEIPTWGTMVASSTQYADRALWTLVFPGLAIVLTALSLQVLGDGVRDLLDPRLKGSV